ncbi:MAG TPA: hypothetical protein VNC39_06315 [Acidocella sp.]|uniref:hypothetical protein n=1 Tax=Acidocella sp. TaxID=50710 RepID=UPI002C388773|nr:hypothetical protein [Acidocella sp.]HVE21573.1 hypothetical protein [Acidocella sp.]
MTHRPPARPSRKAAAAGKALLAPTPERLKHGTVSRARDSVADAHGGIGLPWLVETPLQRLYERGAINQAQLIAGEQFQRIFRLAHHDALRAADLLRDVRHSAPVDAVAVERARDSVWQAIRACGGMGSPCGSCAWHVLGNEMTVAEWARREGWGGKPMREEVAKGTLIGTLGVLAQHFRLTISGNF